MFLLWNFVLFLIFVKASPANGPTLKVSTRTHSLPLVTNILSGILDHIIANSSKDTHSNSKDNHSKTRKAFLSDHDCINKSALRYTLQSASLFVESVPASECRLNNNENYQTTISPAKDFDPMESLNITNQLYPQLAEAVKQKLNLAQVPILFTNTTDVPPDFLCTGDFYQLTQVVFRQTLLHATLQLVVLVPPHCMFTPLDSRLRDTYSTVETIDIPVNGTFECVKGRLSTCSMAKSTTKSPLFKLSGSE